MAPDRTRRLIFITLCATLFVVVSSAVLLLFLPGYLETTVIPGLAEKAGFEPVAIHIRKIGLTGADLADVTVGAPNSRRLAIDSIRIDYSLTDLFRGRIAQIVVSGLSLHVDYRSGVLTVEGIESLFPPGNDSAKPPPASSPAFSVGSISVRNSVVTCRCEAITLQVPFALSAIPDATMRGMDLFTLQLSPRDQFLTIEGSFPPSRNTAYLSLTGEGLLLERFSDIIGYLPGLTVRGRADINARATLLVQPFKVSSLSVSSRLHGAAIKYGGIIAHNAMGADNTESPTGVSLKTDDFGSWEVRLSPFLCITPAGATRIEAIGTVSVADSGLTAEAVVQTGAFPEPSLPPSPSPPVVVLPAFRWEIAASYENESGWRAEMKGRASSEETAPELTARSEGLRVRAAAPAISLAASGIGAAFSGAGIFDMPSLEIGTADAPQAFTAKGISAHLPFQWPLTGDGTPGKFSVSSLQWQKLSLGGIAATVRQRGEGVVVTGNYNSLLLPGLSVGFSADAALTEKDWIASGKISLPAYHIADDIDLGRFLKEAAGVFMTGKIHLAADLAVSESGPAGSISAGLQNARVRLSDTGLVLDGLSMDLSFPDALALRSAPRQVVRASKISYGNIVATDFSADFQIESPSSVFIEQSRFKWCGGNVDSQAFRISPGINDYRLTLYCDRLNLAGILEQFGAAKADGDGTMNGRIPVSFSGNRLAFQDGFLYSTPGGGGKIKLADTKMLTAGLPPDSPEFVQMDIAREALKDFEYSWVRMNLGTEGKELLMQLKFDGKPATPLPFVYKRDIGRFIRLEGDAKGSVFQGIRLDVNFRLPLDDILKYKEALNRMK